MKTFKQFLLEEEEPEQLYQWLREHCQPFLTACGIHAKDDLREILDKAILYRGITPGGGGVKMEFVTSWGDKVEGLVKGVRKDRKPLDTHPDLAKLADQALAERFGWPPRSTGLFAFGKMGRLSTHDYGDPHRIFPMGEFKYVWSPRINDMTNRLLTLTMPREKDVPFNKEELDRIRHGMQQELVPLYKDTGLEDAIKGRAEIMLSCKSYVALEL